MKLAVIGTGKIVKDALYAMSPVDHLELTAIYARAHSLSRAEAFARQYDIPEIYTDYAELLRETAADTVYIGLVNQAHYPYAREALLAGKHVILEKPFTSYLQQAEELAKLARERGLFLLEAITVLHNEVYRKMEAELCRIGTPRMVLSNYSQYSSVYEKYLQGEAAPAFSPENNGGALYDINVYNIHYCVGLFGAPIDAVYYPNQGFNGIDTSGTLVLVYDGFSAVCTGAKDSDSPCFVSVQGESGYLRIDGKPNAATELTISYVDPAVKEKVKDASGAMVRATILQKYTAPVCYHRMTQEFADFTRIIDTQDTEAAEKLLTESLAVVMVLETARTKCRIW